MATTGGRENADAHWCDVIDDDTLSGPEKLVLLSVLRQKNGDGTSQEAISQIAARSGFKRRHTQRIVRTLMVKGKLEIIPRAGQSNLFRLVESGELGRGVTQDTSVLEDAPHYIGKHLRITKAQHENLRGAYPTLDLNSEYPKMDVYNDTLKPEKRWKNFYQGARNWCARIKTPQQGGNYGRNRPAGNRDTKAMQGGLARFKNIGRKAAPAVE